jgi:hypothetical protein
MTVRTIAAAQAHCRHTDHRDLPAVARKQLHAAL